MKFCPIRIVVLELLWNEQVIIMSDAGDGLAEVKRRFAEISEEQLQTTVENKDAVNTKRSTNQAVKILREYLEEKAQSNN